MASVVSYDALLSLASLKLQRDQALREGYYAVDGNRYHISLPIKGKWKDWMFLATGSDYHDRKTMVMRKPDGSFVFKSARGEEILSAILADPIGCMQAYGAITGRCAVCQRKLEDPESVRLGIGPVCIQRLLGA